MLAIPNILLLSDDEQETAELQQLLCEHVRLTPVEEIADLANYLKHNNYDAVFCSWLFHEGRWAEALSRIQTQDPRLPVIIFSRTGDEREWIDVLQAGAFDLLVAPYSESNILGVIEQAEAYHEATARNFGSRFPQLKVIS